MGCCGKPRKPLAKRSKPDYLPGAEGMVLLEYRGMGEPLFFPPSLITGAWYSFNRNGKRYGYVDQRDLSRVTAFKENGQQVLFEVTTDAIIR